MLRGHALSKVYKYKTAALSVGGGHGMVTSLSIGGIVGGVVTAIILLTLILVLVVLIVLALRHKNIQGKVVHIALFPGPSSAFQ